MARGVGTGAATLLGRPLMRAALGAGPPRRLLLLYMPNCSIRATWIPTGGARGGRRRRRSPFTLKAASATLEPVRGAMTLVDGLDLPNIGGDAHGSGIIRLMTGGTIRAGESARDPEEARSATATCRCCHRSIRCSSSNSPMLKGPPFRRSSWAPIPRADDGRTDVNLRVMSYDLKLQPLRPGDRSAKTYTRLFSM